MNAAPSFSTGLETLLEEQIHWIQGHRVGLVSHTAAVDRSGRTSAERLRSTGGVNLTALFGPEHGYHGVAAAGELTPDGGHPEWHIPVYSLYGETRKPTPAMLSQVDLLIVEFQDLGARPYTYVSTLRLVLEAAAEAGLPVIVADRPVPLPRVPDGPMLEPSFESFVGFIPAPMQYAMTPGETALWLASTLNLKLDLRVAPMRGYHRDPVRQPGWAAWIPPSPRIRTWDAACLFTATVFGEALPALDYGSGTELSFQVIGAPWLRPAALADHLKAQHLRGIEFVPHRYHARSGLYAHTELEGLRLVITDHEPFRPVATSVALLSAIQEIHGLDPLWTAPGTREAWFDTLYGTNRIRLDLKRGVSAPAITAAWSPALDCYSRSRLRHLLYS